MDTKKLWIDCLNDIELELSKPNFSTWFKNTSIAKEDGGVIYIGVPNEFVKDWLLNKFHKMIFKTIRTYYEDIRSVEYIISKFDPKQNQESSDRKQVQSIGIKELPLQDLYINKEDNLNPRYTFDSFIVGSFNELAYAAAQAIIKNPGKTYNPFFIYGPTGLGKTHLIQSIGNAIKTKYPEKKVYYMTQEKFAVDYINAVTQNKSAVNTVFKEKYRKYDVLIMDDIQFIGKAEKTQEELFHLFNIMYESNRQIIFSSDKHPNFIPGLEDRLKSRFSQGMIVDINKPDFESRLAIIKAKVAQSNIIIEQPVLEYVASSLDGNIRELEGNFNAIICQAELRNKPLTLSEVKNLIKNNIKPKSTVQVSDVVKVVAEFYNLTEEIIYNKTRRKEVVKARQIVMFILREDFNVSYPHIGMKLGGKDHTTVIHSCTKITEELKTDMSLVQELEQLRTMFK
jgi:chromosomal replication initiator protein